MGMIYACQPTVDTNIHPHDIFPETRNPSRGYLTQHGLHLNAHAVFPPAPSFTEKDIPSQKGKVFIVTGGNQGVGFELINMLYPTDATIYMTSRSSPHALSAISEITASDPSRAGNLKFLHLDLMDLHSVRAAAEEFSAREENLDILWSNAGIGGYPRHENATGHRGTYGGEYGGGISFHALAGGMFEECLGWEGGGIRKGDSACDLENGGCGNEYADYAASRTAGWMMGVEAGKSWGERILSLIQTPTTSKPKPTAPSHPPPNSSPSCSSTPPNWVSTLSSSRAESHTNPHHQGAYIFPGAPSTLRWTRERARNYGSGGRR
ncbi:hypothetical protein EAF00_004016 [Botryotinia globosa]|nr:hypothetical protein EAF00_004016 [Botryotinia globosa]